MTPGPSRLRRLRANPRPFALAAIGVAAIAGFFVVVAPLFDFSGAPSAELGGVIPQRASAGSPVEIDVGFDNTGTSIIDPVCLLAGVTGPLAADHAVFQGLDSERFRGGRACGGSLNGQETISIKVYLRPTGTGAADVSLTPAQRATAIGPSLSGGLSLSR